MRIRLVIGAMALLASAPSFAQEMDMNEMVKWAQAKLIRYHVVGQHDGKATVSSTGSGYGDVHDTVTLDFNWDLSAGLVGQVAFKNAQTSVTNLRDFEAKCVPPIIKGPFEFLDVKSVTPGVSMTLVLTGTTSYPVVEVAKFCTSRTSVPAKVVDRRIEIEVMSPVLFGMGAAPAANVKVNKSNHTLVVTKPDGWVWTFSPAVAK